MTMRDAFLDKLTQLALKDKNVVLLTADLGFGVFEAFESKFPGQYFNVGVAEQNMTGLAAGLALEGKKVITYSIGNFPTLRCLEQIRNDACYHNLNITIVASGGGFSYGSLGMSHHATEDIAILRALPAMSVVAPGTVWEAGEAIEALVKSDGVGYLRLDKTVANESGVFSFSLGGSIRYRKGRDVTLLSTGGILRDVVEAAELLQKQGIDAGVVSMHSVKPIDKNAIISAANESGGIVTIEEHNIDGGLGSAVAEVCMDNDVSPKVFLRIGLDDRYSSIVGSQDYLKAYYEMDSSAIVKKVQVLLE
ncbi:transketolase family protein [Bathymodiolus azoricus thioautotrophic gill symbiont]|jgi:transketolase|nr:transketolase C-terminal domain-containing protein [Bathymodiolus azoricus thioautotrophic gill symbiont]